VRKIIKGKAYDTDKAELVASGSHVHELSDAWWSLYRTSVGAWFEVAAGHDGVMEFQPFTDGEARCWLERHANHLVERYFGEAPEASALVPKETETKSSEPEYPPQAAKNPTELVTLKPTLWGMSIDLKELWRRFCAWRENRK
jgi:hypothetical protein